MKVEEIRRILDKEWEKEKKYLFLILVMILVVEIGFKIIERYVEVKWENRYLKEAITDEVEVKIPVIKIQPVESLIETIIEEKKTERIKEESICTEEVVEPEHDYDWYMNTSYMSLKDIDLLARIISSEAGNQSVRAQELVGITVMNRVSSNEYPDTIYQVIYQKLGNVYQFSPVADERINNVPYKGAYEVARRVLEGDVEWVDGLVAFESISEGDVHSDWADVCIREDSMTFYKER